MLEAKYRATRNTRLTSAARVLSFPFLRGFDSYVALREIVCFDSRRSDGLGRRLPRRPDVGLLQRRTRIAGPAPG